VGDGGFVSALGYSLAAGGVAFGIYGGQAFFRQHGMVFKPTSELLGTPGDLGESFEDIWLPISGNTVAHGWWIGSAAAQKIFLYLPGSIGNISHELSTIAFLRSCGASVLIVDYPGFGRSSGRPSERGCYKTADAAWSWAVSKLRCQGADIVAIGRSLGATVAAWLAARRDVAALVCHSGFSSVADVAASAYPFLPARYFCYIRFNTCKHIRGGRCPVLVLHPERDTIIPISHGQKIFAAAPPRKRFLTLCGDHYGNEWQRTPGLRTELASLLANEVRS
jgi:pimeloyl-ACP methyl ester carboxylesterase